MGAVAMEKESPIIIPKKKGVHVKAAGKKRELYVYKNTNYYRTASGQSRHDCICIGKVYVDDPSKMIPNKNYYNIFNKTDNIAEPQEEAKDSQKNNVIEEEKTELPTSNMWNYGYTYLIFKTAKDLGLLSILESVLGNKFAMDIITIAAYIIYNGNSMDGMEEWQDSVYLPYEARKFSSSVASRLFEELDYSKRQAILQQWVAENKELDSICYDVTSISSYSNNEYNPEVEYGYNRDHEKLPQINMGYFTTLSTPIPLYYVIYNGSLNDGSNLDKVTRNAKEIGLSNFHFYSDGAFFSQKCFKALKHTMKSFTTRMPKERKITKKYIDKVRDIIDSYNNIVPGFNVFCVVLDGTVYKTKGKILVYYDRKKVSEEEISLNAIIERKKGELKDKKKMPRATKQYTDYFILGKDSEGKFTFKLDCDKIDEMRKYNGYFVLFSTNKEITPYIALYNYRDKDVNEKMFFQVKNPMSCDRLHTHEAITADGKVFVTFICTVLRTRIHNQLHEYLQKKSFSMKRIFAKLNNIQMAYGSEGYRLFKTITKEQREILMECGAFDDIENLLKTLIKKCDLI